MNAESGFTFDGTTVQVPDRINYNTNGTYLKENQLAFNPTGTAYLDHYRTGQDIQIRMSTSSSLDTTGPTFKSNGNLAFASGKGIDFSATGDASSSESTTSMSNELFDDYEVGSWQPTWSAVHGTINHLSRHGDYVKIGRTVHCMFAISANGSSLSNASELKITGLPFSATIPNANGPRGGGGVVFPGAAMNGNISKVVCSGTTMRIQLDDGSFLQTNSSGVSFGYNAAQISGMFSFITAS